MHGGWGEVDSCLIGPETRTARLTRHAAPADLIIATVCIVKTAATYCLQAILQTLTPLLVYITSPLFFILFSFTIYFFAIFLQLSFCFCLFYMSFYSFLFHHIPYYLSDSPSYFIILVHVLFRPPCFHPLPLSLASLT